nr:MAG TPA: putative transcriptional regulator [Caudoviricetes sp.]
MTKKERLEALIAHYSNGKPTQFAKYIGVAPSTISTWLARDSFDYDLLFAKCENISPEWLFTGNGDMLKTTDESEPTIAEQRPTVTIYPAKHVDDWYQGIPLIPFSAMAGALRGEIQVCEYECEHYIVPEFKTANFLITINGDSMLPTYKSGDIVACQREAMTSVFFQWNRPYVLDTAQGAILKRIRPGSDKEHILIVSDNPAYIPFELPLSEIYSVALVVGFIRLE